MCVHIYDYISEKKERAINQRIKLLIFKKKVKIKFIMFILLLLSIESISWNLAKFDFFFLNTNGFCETVEVTDVTVETIDGSATVASFSVLNKVNKKYFYLYFYGNK